MTPQVISLSSATSTAWIPVDYKQNPYNIGLSLVFSNTPNLTCKVEYTLDDVFNSAITPTAFAHATLSNITSNNSGIISFPVRAIRLTVTSWTSGTVTLTALQGATNPRVYTSYGGGAQVFKFSGWPTNTGYLLASLVTSTTASRTSNVVTVAATAHGVTTGTTYVGFKFYYPGSASLTAGWYDSILTVPNANSLTFSATGADFGSESVNSAAAWTTATDVVSYTIPGNTLKDGSKVTVSTLRVGDTTATSKTASITFGGSVIGTVALGATPHAEFKFGFRVVGTAKQYGISGVAENASSATLLSLTKDVTTDQTLTLRGTIAAAGSFIAYIGANLEIIV
jgi:hypothetical protein